MLLDLLAKKDRSFYNKREASMISKWETNASNPPERKIVILLAKVLRLNNRDTDDLLTSANYNPAEEQELREILQDIKGQTYKVSEQVDDVGEQVTEVGKQVEGVRQLSELILASMNPGGSPIIGTGSLGFVGATVQRAVFPTAYLGLVGTALNTLHIDSTGALLTYVAIGLAAVLTQGFLRLRRSKDEKDASLQNLITNRGYRYGELLFISIFVMFSAPLLQSTITGMDSYGFFANPKFAGTVLPLLLAIAVNLFISLVVVVLFQILWLWQYRKTTGTAYGRALKVLIPSLLTAYVPVAIFTAVGSETYYLSVIALLFAAFMVMISFSDPEVKLGEWEAKVAFAASIGAICVLFVVAIVGMLVNYTGSQTPSYGNHLWKWTIDYSALGYAQTEVTERMRIGYIWMMFAGIAYMLFMVGTNLLVTIYRNQIKQYRKSEKA
jgi:hypothetical protein